MAARRRRPHERRPVWSEEARFVVLQLHRPTALVHQSVMCAAEGEQVVELGLSVLRPVLDVVSIEKAAVVAAGKAAAAGVSDVEGARESGRNRSGAAADVEDLARFVDLHEIERAVARDAAPGLGGDPGSVVEVGDESVGQEMRRDWTSTRWVSPPETFFFLRAMGFDSAEWFDSAE